MGAITPAVRSHLWRLVRLPAFTSLALALVVPLIHTWVAAPAAGIIIGLLEIVVRTIAPTVPAPTPVVPGPSSAPPPGPS